MLEKLNWRDLVTLAIAGFIPPVFIWRWIEQYKFNPIAIAYECERRVRFGKLVGFPLLLLGLFSGIVGFVTLPMVIGGYPASGEPYLKPIAEGSAILFGAVILTSILLRKRFTSNELEMKADAFAGYYARLGNALGLTPQQIVEMGRNKLRMLAKQYLVDVALEVLDEQDRFVRETGKPVAGSQEAHNKMSKFEAQLDMFVLFSLADPAGHQSYFDQALSRQRLRSIAA